MERVPADVRSPDAPTILPRTQHTVFVRSAKRTAHPSASLLSRTSSGATRRSACNKLIHALPKAGEIINRVIDLPRFDQGARVDAVCDDHAARSLRQLKGSALQVRNVFDLCAEVARHVVERNALIVIAAQHEPSKIPGRSRLMSWIGLLIGVEFFILGGIFGRAEALLLENLKCIRDNRSHAARFRLTKRSKTAGRLARIAFAMRCNSSLLHFRAPVPTTPSNKVSRSRGIKVAAATASQKRSMQRSTGLSAGSSPAPFEIALSPE